MTPPRKAKSEPIRVLFLEAFGLEREVLWIMQRRGLELYLYNRHTLTKRLSPGDAERFLAGEEFPHGTGRRVKFLGRAKGEVLRGAALR
jgi:hypothetical protein